MTAVTNEFLSRAFEIAEYGEVDHAIVLVNVEPDLFKAEADQAGHPTEHLEPLGALVLSELFSDQFE